MLTRLPNNKSPLYGAALIVLIALLTSISNSLTHSLPSHLPSSQILFLKSLIGFVLVALLFKGDFKRLFTTHHFRWQFFKGAAGAVGNGLWIAAVQVLPLGDSSALSLTSALMTTLGAYYFFSEVPKKPTLIALALGFFGVLLILKPTHAVFQVYSFYPLFSALAFSISSLIVKKVSITDRSETTLSYLLLWMAVLSLVPAVHQWQPLSGFHFLKLIGIALLYAGGQLALIEAYTYTQAAFLPPCKLSRCPLAIAAGWLFFNEPFSWSTFIGGTIIIFSYFYLLRQKNKISDECECPCAKP